MSFFRSSRLGSLGDPEVVSGEASPTIISVENEGVLAVEPKAAAFAALEPPLSRTNIEVEDERAYPGEGKGAVERDEEIAFPDGGLRAWLVVAGGCATTFASFGFVNAWGAFQDYYETSGFLEDVSPSAISWIGSVQYSLTFLPGLITGRLFDLGYFHIPMIAASCLLVVASFLVAECTQYWQLVLGQGIAIGLGSGFTFGGTLAVVSQWFKKRRSLAFGIVAIGSSIGGTTLPIAVSRLLPLVGFKWTMRIVGFLIVLMTTFANLTLRRRLKPVFVKGGLINPAAFKYLPYTMYTLASGVTFLGLYTALTYFPVAATSVGIPTSFAQYLVPIANGSSTFGRLSGGLIADRIGPISVLIPFTALAAVMTFIWPHCTSIGSLTVVAVIYGFAAGAYVGLMAAPIAQMGALGDMGRRLGMTLSIASFFALTGPPISGAIYDTYGSFHQVGYFAGSMIIFSVVLLAWSKWLAKGSLFAKF